MSESAVQRAAAETTAQTIKAVTALPEYPADCSARERSGVTHADRLDVALIKTDQALTRANLRTVRCVAWYNRLREVRHGQS